MDMIGELLSSFLSSDSENQNENLGKSLGDCKMELYCGDCLDILPGIDMSNVSLVFADLPYGKTNNKWDVPIDLSLLWSLLPSCTCVFTASNGFEFELFNSNPTQYNYKWIWNKNNSAGFALAKRRPLNVTEDVLVFRSNRYYPQMETRGKERVKGGYGKSDNYRLTPTVSVNNQYYPKSLINISNNNQRAKRNPTQKPVDLLEYLIRTYTVEGSTVLDPVMGSGSTGEACWNTGRKFIGIEKDENQFLRTSEYLIQMTKEASVCMITKGQNSVSVPPCDVLSEAGTPDQTSSQDVLQGKPGADSEASESSTPLLDSMPASSLDADTYSALDSLCKEYRDLSSKISKLTEDQKLTKEAIESLILSLNVKKITSPSWCTVRSQKTSTYLDKETMYEECTKNNIDPSIWWSVYEISLKEKKSKEFISVVEGIVDQPQVDITLFD